MELADQVAAVAARVVASGAISVNGHGNVSLRVPGRDEIVFSTAPTLHGLRGDDVARLSLDGKLLAGQLPPINAAVVAMHAELYKLNDETGCVIHTHSPYATAYAVAGRPIDCWIEALAMFGLADGVPVTSYAPRGSTAAVGAIREAVRTGVPAVLLANHGVLVFHRTPELALLIGGIVEEAAQAGINAAALGGPQIIPAAMRAAALQRAMTFAAAGTLVADEG